MKELNIKIWWDEDNNHWNMTSDHEGMGASGNSANILSAAVSIMVDYVTIPTGAK